MKKRREFIRNAGLASAGFLVGCRPSNGGNSPVGIVGIVDVRKAARHFAMLYFHFCKILVDTVGEDAAFPLVQKAIFNLSIDRTDRMRAKAQEQGLEPTLENFTKVNDLASVGWKSWEPSMGGVRCPYAQSWLGYYDDFPWFKRFAPLFCDVIDTTNIENFTRTTSHNITKNLLWGDQTCEREYFESEPVKQGKFTYEVK